MKLILLVVLLSCSTALSQRSLEVYDISQKQLQVLRKQKASDATSRDRIFIDSIYTPYRQFWEGYLGDGNAVAKWMNGAVAKLPELESRNRAVNSKKLIGELRHVARQMTRLTGYEPKGKWYVVYGPAWTDLGGLGDFAMLIDLSHENNTSNEKIARIFPHELTHQIMTNVNPNRDNSAISTIIGEGFAVWMNQKYWGKTLTLAENLGYSESELQACDKNLEVLKKMLIANKYSTDKAVIDAFRNRAQKPAETLPGAIGYYLGYRIVESYVRKNGENSWKDFFVKSPRDAYETSGFAQ